MPENDCRVRRIPLLLCAVQTDIVQRRWVAALPYLLTVLFIGLVATVTQRHEMWRDEMQAWLLARDSATPLQLLHHMRYDGHPCLWHLLLWPLAHLSPNPLWMQVLHVALAGASAFLVLRWSPFSWPVRLLIILGYYFTYEWTVIARNYAISALLLFAVCALFKRRWVRFPALAALLFLLCLSNIHSILLVLVFALTLSIEFAVSYAGRYRDAARCLGRFLAGMALIGLGLYTGIRQVAPPDDTGFATGWNWHWKNHDTDQVGSLLVRAYLPVPVDRTNFWNSNRFLDASPKPGTLAIPGHPSPTAAGALVLMIGSLFFLKRPWLLAPFWLGSAALLAFFHVKYLGFARHHGFLFLLFIALLWMSCAYRPWVARRRWVEWLPAWWDRHRMKALLPLLAVHVWAAAIAIHVEWTAPFSQAKAAAAWISTQFGDLTTVTLVGDTSPAASAVLGYLQAPRIYYPDRRDFGSYLIWDQARLAHGGQRLDHEIPALMKQTGKDALLILDHELGAVRDGGSVTLLNRFVGCIQGDENYWLYRWRRDGDTARAP